MLCTNGKNFSEVIRAHAILAESYILGGTIIFRRGVGAGQNS